jgi:pimeloyl-ACP methyl ester carboxylesterase
MIRCLLLLILCYVIVTFAANPDDSRNVTQMIQARGYPVEDHYVVTSDGFVLSIQRITGKRNTPGSPTVSKPVVVLQHGLLDNSITWVVQEVVNESLGFILADEGYDVWMPNARGNTYSNTNVHYKPSQSEFWAWSFDEMAHIDLPTVLGYILKTTNQKTVSYVGHSQGTTMGFIGFEDAQTASMVNVFVALAPVGWVYHTGSVLLKAMADLDAQVWVQLLGIKDFAPDLDVLKVLLPSICSVTPTACDNIMGLVMGWDTTNLNNTRLPVILAHEPSGTSTQNILHWTQEVKKNVFQAYDYGSASANEKHYNQSSPPSFDPSLITIPTALFSGGNDSLADPKDVAYLTPLLKNVVYNHFEPSYAHLDFVWGVNACTKIYPAVLQLIQKYGGKPSE